MIMSTKTENRIEISTFAILDCEGCLSRVLGRIRSSIVASIVARSLLATRRWSDHVSDRTLRDVGLERADVTTQLALLAAAREQAQSYMRH